MKVLDFVLVAKERFFFFIDAKSASFICTFLHIPHINGKCVLVVQEEKKFKEKRKMSRKYSDSMFFI